MAEISYPFAESNASGGSHLVSQAQWHYMAHVWGGDRIDFSLNHGSYDASALPFHATVSARTITVSPGNAWVGGFYYQLTEAKTFEVPDNLTDTARKDLIALRADLSAGSVNLVLIQGQPAANPSAPQPRRLLGQVWEMALYEVDAPVRNGSPQVSFRPAFNPPPAVSTPWNTQAASSFMPPGSFLYDMASNLGDTQQEAWTGRDGYVVTRHFGKSKNYTPELLNVTTLPASYRSGRWRWIAPNTFWFQVTIDNQNDSGAMVTGSNWRAGISLPASSNRRGIQVIHGYLSNPNRSGNLPNALSITATTHPGSTNLYLHTPSRTSLAEGLDGLPGFPATSVFSISGVVEANQFSE